MQDPLARRLQGHTTAGPADRELRRAGIGGTRATKAPPPAPLGPVGPVPLLKDALPSTLPVVLNGDVFTPRHPSRAELYGGRLADACPWRPVEPSIFAVRYSRAPYGAETAEPREAAAVAAELAKEAKVAATLPGPRAQAPMAVAW